MKPGERVDEKGQKELLREKQWIVAQEKERK
jgi:hypothetical protein